jgi:predicted dehydrogenase
VRWGILATGKIASGFARALQLLPDAELAAVAARRLESAERFALAYGAPATRAYGSYAELVADPEVDVVYVATPHALHHEHTMLAFDAGKPVLCEKALTLTAREAEDLVRVSRERRLFFMEAMWMRCNPVIRRVKQLAERGDPGGSSRSAPTSASWWRPRRPTGCSPPSSAAARCSTWGCTR